ncbi:MAG: type II toxin-antitoxin system RelE/ParE family toxin [Cryomorphaceae bacterium]|nr:type II toxin-antitoxin system RelE/ParE family toxin [Cryomorphaceae bacterium]
MNIEWTLEAKKDLEKIYIFYTIHFSVALAQKIKKQALSKVKMLELGTELGQEEELLKHLNQGHRYLISNHNKIIYKIEN